jgi:hypothetical protein
MELDPIKSNQIISNALIDHARPPPPRPDAVSGPCFFLPSLLGQEPAHVKQDLTMEEEGRSMDGAVEAGGTPPFPRKQGRSPPLV